MSHLGPLVLRYKHFERWATANDFPVENVINDGSTTLEDRLGAVADLELAIRSRRLADDVMVVRRSPALCHVFPLEPELNRMSVALRSQETCCAPTRTLTWLRSSASSGRR